MTARELALDRRLPDPPKRPVRPAPAWKATCEHAKGRHASRGFPSAPCGRPTVEQFRGFSLCGTHALAMRAKPAPR